MSNDWDMILPSSLKIGVFFGITLALTLSTGAYLLLPNATATNTQEISFVKTDDVPLQSSLTEIFEQVEAGVVSITVVRNDINSSSGVGSGIIFDHDGNIVTNNHVIDDAKSITVTLIDGTSYTAQVVGSDLYSDLAVIEVDVDNSKLHPLQLDNSQDVKVGEQVAAIGNPYGLSGSMTSGIVSQIGRLLPSQNSGFSIPDIIQTDAAINPGNSGGPLLNMQGRVIGINTSIYSNTGTFTGVGFAIPSNSVNKIVQSIIETGAYKHPWIGITSQNILPDLANALDLDEAKGTLVMSVIQDSPADAAGVIGSSKITTFEDVDYQVGGDIIVSIDDHDVRKTDDLITYLQREKSVGDNVVLGIIRDGIHLDIVITLDERPN